MGVLQTAQRAPKLTGLLAGRRGLCRTRERVQAAEVVSFVLLDSARGL